jgi:hypothetical protein
VPVNSEVLVHLNNFESSVHEARPPGPCINCKREDVTKRRGENNHCFILLSSMHMHSKMMLYGWFIFSQFSVTWCCFCIVGHFQWFSKSSLTYSTNTVIIFECICMLDKSIKQWLFSPLRLVTSSRLQFMQNGAHSTSVNVDFFQSCFQI